MDDRLQQLANCYHAQLVAGVKALKRDIGYAAPYFTQMLGQHGGVETTRRLLQGAKTHDGFTTLYEHGQLGRSVEAWMLHPEFEELFTDPQRAIARARLEAHGFDVDRYLRGIEPGPCSNLARTALSTSADVSAVLDHYE